MTECPGDDALARLLDDTEADSESSPLGSHIDGCPRCQRRLDELTRAADLRGWVADGSDTEWGPDTDRRLPEPNAMPTLPGFRVVAELGRGGMGVVYRAFDEHLQREVAVKRLRAERSDGEALDRFVREARAAARVRHPNLAAVYAVITPEDGSAPSMVMEFVAGMSLRQRIERDGPLSPEEAAAIIAQVADGLSAVHAAGLVHRDVKPANVLLSETGPKLADFGLARGGTFETRLTQTGIVLGTPVYMPPEQVLRPSGVDGRADVYSLGATLYEAITGSPPFQGTPHMVLRQVLDDDPQPPRKRNDQIPVDLETVCLKAMAKEPHKRYQTAGELAAELRRFSRGEPVTARPPGRVERLARWCRRNPRIALLTGTVAVLLLTVAVGSSIFAGAIFAEQKKTKEALDDAEASAAAARLERRIASEAYFVLLTEVEERMRTRPGLADLRKDFLEKADAGLRRMVDSGADSPTIDRALLITTDRLGDALRDLGQPTDAAESYRRAIGMAEAILRDDPDNAEIKTDLSRAKENLGLLLAQSGDMESALRLFQEVRQLRRDAFEALGTPETARNLAVGLSSLGLAAGASGRFDEAAGHYREAAGLIERLTDDHPGDRLYERDLRRIYSRLAEIHEFTGRLDEAARDYREALSSAESLAADDPKNPQLRRDVAYLHNRLALLGLKRDVLDDAENHAAEYRRLAAELHAAEPNVAKYHLDVAWAEERSAQVAIRRGRLDDSAEHWRAAIETVGAMLNGEPDSADLLSAKFRYLLGLASSAERRGEYLRAEELCRQALAVAESLAAKSPSPAGRGLVAQLDDYLAALAEMGRALTDLEFAEGLAEQSAGMVWGIRGLHAARKGDLAAAAEDAERLIPFAEGESALLFTLARIYSLCAKASTPGSAEYARFADLARKHLEAARAANPLLEDYLEPDLLRE